VKPLVVNDSGITPGKEKGVHDSDYYVEVTVINNALLKTTKTIKVGVYACAARRRVRCYISVDTLVDSETKHDTYLDCFQH
jgi:hypothetical protein